MSSWGNLLRISIFGESHGLGIGVVIDGLPAGRRIDFEAVSVQMTRRAPGQGSAVTPRREPDVPKVLSGLKDNVTTGAPLCCVIENTNVRSGDYSDISNTPRPSHADYAARERFGEACDMRGGGHFSGRLTAPLTFAGTVCRQILADYGVHIGGHLYSVGGVADTPFDPVNLSPALLDSLSLRNFAVINPSAETAMREHIEAARQSGDSAGGIIEAAAVNVKPGLGSPMFLGVENALASLLFGIPGVKGVEFGTGFGICGMRGSAANDAFIVDENNHITTATNHSGGIQGGISNGMPIIVRVAFKPTPSIALPQNTVSLDTQQETTVQIRGRHDPCIAVRAVPVVEAALAMGLLELYLRG